MKHSIRQRVLDPVTGLMVTKIETVNGELGSGIVDKNGREIFEGDIVKVSESSRYTVHYHNGALRIGDQNVARWGSSLEIVGHAED